MKTPEQIRAEFEAWYANAYQDNPASKDSVRRCRGLLENSMWVGWQACAAKYETVIAEKDAEIARLREALRYIRVYDCCCPDGSGSSCDTLDLINKCATEALEQPA